MMPDLQIIGGGPAGYTAALKASKLGAKVRLFEKHKLGGTCLQAGCIPTKTLLESSGLIAKLKKANYLGVNCGAVSPNFIRMMQRKSIVINKLTLALEQELSSNNIEIVYEQIDLQDLLKQSSKIIIASGTSAKQLPNTLSTDDVLKLSDLPESLQIYGAGAVGLELATLFRQLGSKVTVSELAEQILPDAVAPEVAVELQKLMEKQGIKFELGATSTNTMPSDKVIGLSCIGRRLNTESFTDAQLKLNARGDVHINDYLQTNLPNVYAAGDITGKLQLAHVAYAQGLSAACNALGQNIMVNYDAVPFCVFTSPVFVSVGSPGKLEPPSRIRLVAFAELGISQAKGETDGFLRLVLAPDNKTVSGVQILGFGAAELVSVATLIVGQKMTLQGLAQTIWAHPTLGEIFALNL